MHFEQLFEVRAEGIAPIDLVTRIVLAFIKMPVPVPIRRRPNDNET